MLDRLNTLFFKGKKIRFNASDELELSCGKSSIVLKSSGKVIIKGTRIVSHARESNTTQGGIVRMN
ncbi:MAG: hypothetical protein V1793_17760 [Pseudomonadota bacterium]